MSMEEQLAFFPQQGKNYTVYELNSYLRGLIEADPGLQDIWVSGEVSNLSIPKSGHMYFTLKDAQASLRCVMWRNQVVRQINLPQDGTAVEVHGSISVYEVGGQYQLYADQIRPAGEGLLYQEFIRLKNKLEAEGLFAEERKRPLPPAPKVIGVVTSPTGAAIRDILNTISRRYPLARVVVAPSSVQGDAAPGEIVRAMQQLNQEIHPDVVLVGRGGGSIEDLWAFNDEAVARAIYNSAAPVISGVGHETDFTIADFTADLRAPTPTAAAELAVPDQLELRDLLIGRMETLQWVAEDHLDQRRFKLGQTQTLLQRSSPGVRLASARQKTDELYRRAERAVGHHIQLSRTRLLGLTQQLAALNPTNVLGRGYAVVSHREQLVRSTMNVQPGDELKIQVRDGAFHAEVTENGDQDDR